MDKQREIYQKNINLPNQTTLNTPEQKALLKQIQEYQSTLVKIKQNITGSPSPEQQLKTLLTNTFQITQNTANTSQTDPLQTIAQKITLWFTVEMAFSTYEFEKKWEELAGSKKFNLEALINLTPEQTQQLQQDLAHKLDWKWLTTNHKPALQLAITVLPFYEWTSKERYTKKTCK